jgi:hypothetical protein
MARRRFWSLLALALLPILAGAKPCCAEHIAVEYQTVLGGDQTYGRFYMRVRGTENGRLVPVRPTGQQKVDFRIPVSGFGRSLPPLMYHALRDSTHASGDLQNLCFDYPLACTLSTYEMAGGGIGGLDLYGSPGEEPNHRLIAPRRFQPVESVSGDSETSER